MPEIKLSLLLKLVSSIVFSTLIVSAIYGTMMWATGQSDESAIERQSTLVALVVSKMQDKIAHDQESATVWDDAVRKVGEDDHEWIDANLGRWMHTYFGHDAAFVLGPANKLIYGFSSEEANEDKAYSTVSLKARKLIDELRRRLAASDTSGTSDKTLSIGETDIVSISGSPAIISVKPIVSDSGKIEQTPGQQPLHVAVQYLDRDFAKALGSDYLFSDMRFEWRKRNVSERSYFPLKSRDGNAMGYFSWKAFRPGSAVLRATEPVLAVGGLMMVAAIAGLVALLHGRANGLRRSQRELFHLAHHDALSGLPNRLTFNAEVENTLSTSEATILFLDLDRFKQVNDTLGHPIGDRLIVQVAARLKSTVGDGVMVARLGGDEFTMVIPGAASSVVEELADRLISAIRQPFEIDGQPILIGLSIGIAFSPGGKSDAPDVLRRADIALYSAKSTGRNRYVIFGPHMDEMVKTRRDLEHDLRVALDDGSQMEVHYQPIYTTRDGSLTGVEALSRWRHPVKGIMQPDTFITIAEEVGLIDRLGEHVLVIALADAKRWPGLTMAINASAWELRSDTYALRVVSALAKANFDPRMLEIEITESAVLENEDVCRRNIDTLRKLGVRFALDDFGTGFSSFGRLQQLNVDRIKIDRCFVEGYGTPENNEAIVQAMISLAHAKGMKTTAEGIETDAQMAWLKQLGCDELQGYLLSRPVTAASISDLYATSPSRVAKA